MRAENVEPGYPPPTLTEHLVVAGTLIVAAALRLYRLGYAQFWFDELGQVVAGIGPLRHTLEEAARHLGAAPLDYLIVRVMLNVGSDEAILRLPAALWGVLTVGLLYRLARALYGPLAGVTAAALLAFLPLHIAYSQELRFYSLGAFAAVGAVALFWRAQRSRQRWDWAFYALALALGLYAHYYLMFVAVALGLWTLLYRRESVRACFVATMAAALLFLPWAVFDNVVIAPRRANLNPLSWSLPTDISTLMLNSVASFPTGPQWLGLGDLWLWAGVALLWGGALIAAVRGLMARRPALLLPALLFAATTIGLLMLDIVGVYAFLPRQMVIGAPFLCMAAAAALFGAWSDGTQPRTAESRPAQRFVAPLLAALVIAAILLPSVRYFYATKDPLATLANIGTILYRNARPGDTVLVGGPLDQYRFYVPDLALPASEVPRRRIAELAAAQESERVWLVLWYGTAAYEMRDWADSNGAWDLTPWLNGMGAPASWDDGLPRVYLYSTQQPDAGLEVGCRLGLSPFMEEHGRAYLLQSLADQLRARGRAAEADMLIADGRLSADAELCAGATPQ